MIPVDSLLGVRLALRWARDDADLTQARLAQRVGMTQQQLAKLESGGNPTLSTLSRVARGLGRRIVVSLEMEPQRVVPRGKSSLVREHSPEYLARAAKESVKRRRKR
ncbi:MAG: helix-turn-helix domain-containing protein [Gemmatimonadaceae bacterium]